MNASAQEQLFKSMTEQSTVCTCVPAHFCIHHGISINATDNKSERIDATLWFLQGGVWILLKEIILFFFKVIFIIFYFSVTFIVQGDCDIFLWNCMFLSLKKKLFKARQLVTVAAFIFIIFIVFKNIMQYLMYMI